MINKTFEILIPTINRADLLNPSLEFYIDNFPNTTIRVFDNGHQNIFEHERVKVKKSTTNLGVAGSWNFLADICFRESEFALFLNDDIRILANEDKILDFCKFSKKTKFYCGNISNSFQCYLLSKQIWQRVGKFDTMFFPAYWEDIDYKARMKNLSIDIIQVETLSYKEFEVGGSSNKNPILIEGFHKNRKYYYSKWGSIDNPYRHPFNVEPSKDDILKDFLSQFK